MNALHLLLLAFAAVASARPQPSTNCREVKIPITVNVPRFVINTTVNDNWDATTLTFNLTRRDSGSSAAPLPIDGSISAVESTYTIGATVCGTGGPMLVLTHGIIESKKYWQPNFPGADKYSFIDAAVAAGYSVLSYDRIGVGSSSKVSALFDAQFQVESAVLNELIKYARSVAKATKVAVVGHSYGSYLTAASASQTAVDAVVLTGFSSTFDYFVRFLAGSGFRVAKLKDPRRWGDLDSGYLTTSDLYAQTYIYFAEPHFEHHVAEWNCNVGSEPFSLAELESLIVTPIQYGNITAPVLVLQGQFDVASCGGNCVGALDYSKALFAGAEIVETVDDLPAGHSPFLHKIAPEAFEKVFGFLKAQGV